MAKKIKIPDLKEEEIIVGHCYEAKSPKTYGLFERLIGDRQIKWKSSFKSHRERSTPTEDYLDWLREMELTDCNFNQVEYESVNGKLSHNIETDYEVQYDSPSVGQGKKYPTIPLKKFIKWAARDVTALMPEGKWREEPRK